MIFICMTAFFEMLQLNFLFFQIIRGYNKYNLMVDVVNHSCKLFAHVYYPDLLEICRNCGTEIFVSL